MHKQDGNPNDYPDSVNLNNGQPFPYLVIDVINDDGRPRNPGFHIMHWHEDLQFVYVLEGQLRIVTPTDSTTVAAGEAAFINSSVIHLVRRDGPCHYKSFIFPVRLLKFYPGSPASEFVDRLAGNEAIPVYRIGNDAEHAKILRHLEQLDSLDKGETPESIYAILIELCALWFELDHTIGPKRAVPTNSLASERLRTFLAYIERRYREPLTLEELAASAHVSKSECLRCFKTALQTTPHRYLIEYRLAQAATLLRITNEPVGAVAQNVGFGQQSHFGKCFKEKTGMTPAEYRRSCRRD